jgi:hypothetical protein
MDSLARFEAFEVRGIPGAHDRFIVETQTATRTSRRSRRNTACDRSAVSTVAVSADTYAFVQAKPVRA